MKQKLTKEFCDQLYEDDHLAHKKLVQDQNFKNLKAGDFVICWSNKNHVGGESETTWFSTGRKYRVVDVDGDYFTVEDNEDDKWHFHITNGSLYEYKDGYQMCIYLPYE